MKKKKVLCDTNVISSYLIGLPDAVFLIKNIGFENVVISSITAMELQKWFWSYKGLTQDQISQFREILRLMQIIHIDRKISAPDMLIAGTALQLKIKIATFNIKDFKFIKGINFYNKPRPV
jgi:predicted nucleic acid-binding protein